MAAAGLDSVIESLGQVWATLDRVCNGPVEPRELEIVPAESPASFGLAHAISAPAAISACNVSLQPISGGIRLGDSCNIRLIVSEEGIPRGTEGLASAVATVIAHTRVFAHLARAQAAGVRPPLLSASFTPSENPCEIWAAVALPVAATSGDALVIERIELAGHPIRADLPARLLVYDAAGLKVPLLIRAPTARVHYDDFVFCLSERSTIYIARSASHSSSRVHVLSPDGIACCEPYVIPIRCQSIAIDSVNNILFVSSTDSAATGCPVVALDAALGSVLWNSTTCVLGCYSIAVLPRAGVAIACSSVCDTLFVLRASDGTLLASAEADHPHCVVADEASALVLCSTESLEVRVFRWTGLVLKAVRTIGLTLPYSPFLESSRVLVVVPPARGMVTAHLLVGSFTGRHVAVFSLSSLLLVFETDVPRGSYVAAADATGTSIVLCRNGELEVISWPLPGMPPLR